MQNRRFSGQVPVPHRTFTSDSYMSQGRFGTIPVDGSSTDDDTVDQLGTTVSPAPHKLSPSYTNRRPAPQYNEERLPGPGSPYVAASPYGMGNQDTPIGHQVSLSQARMMSPSQYRDPKSTRLPLPLLVFICVAVPILLWGYIFLFSGIGLTFSGLISASRIVSSDDTDVVSVTDLTASGSVAAGSVTINFGSDSSSASNSVSPSSKSVESDATKVVGSSTFTISAADSDSDYDVDMSIGTNTVLSLGSEGSAFSVPVTIDDTLTATSLVLGQSLTGDETLITFAQSSSASSTIDVAASSSNVDPSLSFQIPVTFSDDVTFSVPPTLDLSSLSGSGAEVTLD
ncbi:hypothetical protein KIPB_006258, partial [Kipferlia bialata]|eukprot:g6258.t1